jgi:hypothetical protein
MPAKEIVVDFYELALPPDAKPFEEMLQGFVQTFNIQQRTKAISGHFVRVSEALFTGDVVEGDFTKIRMDNLPDKGCLDKPDQPLGLQEDEGLSAGRAFFYYIPWKLLVIHRNKNGASIAEIEGYFQQIFGLNGLIELKPVLQKDAYKRLHKMTEVKKFDVKFAGLKNTSLLKGEGHDSEKLIQLLEFFQAPRASISVSVGREKRNKLFIGLKEIASRLGMLAKEHPNTVKKVELSGVDENGKRQFVDLLLDPMFDKISVQTVGRRLPFQVRRNAIAQAFTNQKDDLKKIISAIQSQ